MSAPLTWSGVQSGCMPSRSAAMPETTGAANDVPESSMPLLHDRVRTLRREARAGRDPLDDVPAGRRDARASRSRRPCSRTRPRCVDVVASGSAIPLSSSAPTVITNGSFAGEKRTPFGCAVGRVVAPRPRPRRPRLPELLDRAVERVEAEGRREAALQREVRDADVVPILVLQEPVAARAGRRSSCRRRGR